MKSNIDKTNHENSVELEDPWGIWQKLEILRKKLLNNGRTNMREIYFCAAEISQVYNRFMDSAKQNKWEFRQEDLLEMKAIAIGMRHAGNWRKKVVAPENSVGVKEVDDMVNTLMQHLFEFLDFCKNPADIAPVVDLWKERNANEGFRRIECNLLILQRIYASIEVVLRSLWLTKEKRERIFDEIIEMQREKIMRSMQGEE